MVDGRTLPASRPQGRRCNTAPLLLAPIGHGDNGAISPLPVHPGGRQPCYLTSRLFPIISPPNSPNEFPLGY